MLGRLHLQEPCEGSGDAGSENKNRTMKELTKADRHEIYKRAKELYLGGPGVGMCYLISYTSLIPQHLVTSVFPELILLKPENKSEDEYWWPPDNREVRLKKFDKIIEQTAP